MLQLDISWAVLSDPRSSHAGDVQRELGDGEGAIILGTMVNASRVVVDSREKGGAKVCVRL